jgi:hypothetical protein
MNSHTDIIPDDRDEKFKARVKERDDYQSEERSTKRSRLDSKSHLSSENPEHQKRSRRTVQTRRGS